MLTESLLFAERDRLVRLVRRLLAWPGEAAEVEDVVQEALLRAWAKRDQLRDPAAVRAWLGRIAVQTSRNHQRSKRRRAWLGFSNEAGTVDPVEDLGPREESRDLVRAALIRLSARDRELLVLRYLEGVPGEDVRAMLGLRRAAFDTGLKRARERLRREITRLEEGR